MKQHKLSPILIIISLLLIGLSCYSPINSRGKDIDETLTNWPQTNSNFINIKLHIFNTGMNKVSPLLVGSPAPWRPAPAFLIEHPIHGLI
jgi:hypothetical protein